MDTSNFVSQLKKVKVNELPRNSPQSWKQWSPFVWLANYGTPRAGSHNLHLNSYDTPGLPRILGHFERSGSSGPVVPWAAVNLTTWTQDQRWLSMTSSLSVAAVVVASWLQCLPGGIFKPFQLLFQAHSTSGRMLKGMVWGWPVCLFYVTRNCARVS